MELTKEQQKAYHRYITARDKVNLVSRKNKWVPHSEVLSTVDIAGFNHPFYEPNTDWQEYKEASLAWWAVEPEFRKTERMSMIRGDYDKQDSWKGSK